MRSNTFPVLSPVERTTASSPAPVFPAGIGNIFAFAAFNALSFQIVLGSPMILYAKTLDASATVLGIIAGMMPLLVIFQIPAAKHVASVGYKKFVLGGWSIRVVFIFLMALVPLGEVFLSKESRLSLMLFLLFFFNLSRGISSCGWLPWITSLIPGEIRGRYLSREAAMVNIASFITMIIAAASLGKDPQAWQFAAIIAFSALMGAASLVFLKRIPEVAAPAQIASSNTPVPWKEISSYPPFRKLLNLSVVWSFAYGGMGAFPIAYLKVMAGVPEGKILFMTSAAFIGGLCSLWLLGARLDRLGSKPALALGHVFFLLIVTGWFLLAAKVIVFSITSVLVLMFLTGMSASITGMAMTRLAMAVVPEMGRSHFFALYSVAGSLSLGIAPVIWGVLIDAMQASEFIWQGMDLNRYAWFFLAVFITFLFSLNQCRKLVEPAAGSMEDLLKDILSQSPLRVWVRFWQRF
jgi:MFS family permease